MRYIFEKAVDLTHELHNGMPIYSGDPAPSFVSYATLEKSGVNLTKLTLGSHTGTHIDAPRHFIPDGIGVDQISPNKLTGDAASYLVSKKVRAVGIDFLSVEKFQAPTPIAHKTLLGEGIFIIESLNSATKQFVGKRVLMLCLPIKLRNGDGAPSRIISVPISED